MRWTQGAEQAALASAQLLRDSAEGLGSHLRRYGIANQPEGAELVSVGSVVARQECTAELWHRTIASAWRPSDAVRGQLLGAARVNLLRRVGARMGFTEYRL